MIVNWILKTCPLLSDNANQSDINNILSYVAIQLGEAAWYGEIYIFAYFRNSKNCSANPLSKPIAHMLVFMLKFYRLGKSLSRCLNALAPEFKQGLNPPPGLVQADAK